MAHHHARDGYETVKVPEKFRPLLRRLQRSTWGSLIAEMIKESYQKALAS